MFQVTREINFCYGHRLLSYNGKCKHLHGHNGKVAITVKSPDLDALGMVLDFSQIKATIAHWIENNLDHRMLLHKSDPLVSILKEQGEPVFVMEENPTAENIARIIFDFSKTCGYDVAQVTLWETESCCATYQAQTQQVPSPALLST